MRPTSRTIKLLGIWFVVAIAAAFWPSLTATWAGLGIVLFLLIAVDTWRVYHQTPPDIERKIDLSHPIGIWRDISVIIKNLSTYPLHIQVFDHIPDDCEFETLPLHGEIAPHTQTHTHYRCRFNRRGEHTFLKIEALISAPWQFMQRRIFIAAPLTVRVYPNFAAIAKYALLATDHRLSQIGIRRRRRRGQGLEFHQLREYRDGDAVRQIDWKATSRLRKLISREYQDERDQQIIVLLDCGNRMRTKDGPLSHFDEALNAMLLLAHVALKQGDAVGCMSFGHDTRFIPARKGHGALSILMDRLFDLEPGPNASDYTVAARHIAESIHKRSLILILTNLRDEDSNELCTAIHALRKRHLVLVASLQESAVASLCTTTASDFRSALTTAAAHHYFNTRTKTLERFKQNGAMIIDVTPASLPIALVNRYLDIKRQGVL